MSSQSTDNQKEGLGTVIVITGPSGAGKDSVLDRARELGLEAAGVITTSTRPMRMGEAEGEPYYFISREEFEKKIEGGEMLEWAEVYGNLYGSTKEEVERVRKQTPVVTLKIDPQGARAIKEMMPEVQTVFIKPPTIEFLEQRMRKRATDAEEVILKRLEVAKEEMEHLEQWDHVLLNDEGKLDEASQELMSIIEKL